MGMRDLTLLCNTNAGLEKSSSPSSGLTFGA